MSKDTFATSLVYEICPVCAKKEELLILNSKLSFKNAQEIKNLHGKTIGIKEEPCKECKDYMLQGIIVIGYDEEESKDAKNSLELYRTGAFAVIKESWFEDKPEFDISKRVIFLSHSIMEKLGMIEPKS